MPMILEAPETTRDATWTDDYEADQALVSLPPRQQYRWARIRTWLQCPQIDSSMRHVNRTPLVREGFPQLERGVDILAREHPFLHALSTVG